MKKKYIQPNTEIVYVKTQSFIAASVQTLEKTEVRTEVGDRVGSFYGGLGDVEIGNGNEDSRSKGNSGWDTWD